MHGPRLAILVTFKFRADVQGLSHKPLSLTASCPSCHTYDARTHDSRVGQFFKDILNRL